MEEKTITNKRTTKKCQIVIYKNQMLIEIKGHVKPTEDQLEEHMEYDGMHEDKVNPNGKHQ